MNSISVNYTLVWQFKTYPHIKITRCRKIFNTKSGRKLKITTNGGSIGVWLSKKVFYDTKDNTYWIPFCKEQYFPKWYCYLPSPPKTK